MRHEIKKAADEAFERANKRKSLPEDFQHKVRTAVLGIDDFIFAHKFKELVNQHLEKSPIRSEYSTSGEMIKKWVGDSEEYDVEQLKITTEFTLTPLEMQRAGLNPDEVEAYVCTTVRVRLPTKVSVPFGAYLNRTRSWNSDLTFAVRSDQFQKEDREYVEELIKERWILESARNIKHNKFSKDVKKLVEGTNSTKQLLSRLPAAEAWLPEWVINKMHEDAPKRAKASDKDSIELDDTLLKTTTLTARLLSGSGQDSA
jgi:hypothetical protein